MAGLLLAAPAVCRRHAPHPDDEAAAAPEGAGMLHRIAARLEEAYARTPLPPTREPDKLADRLAKWKGFRDCAARTYAARKATAARGVPLPQGSVGWAAVEECAVQGAVADKDARLCEELAAEFPGPSGKPGLGALRCRDTRARVLGLPDECPVVDLPGGRRGRNPECLAAARRDGSLCVFADDPARCRALMADDAAGCAGASANCRAAVAYWSELVPPGEGKPLTAGPGEATIDLARQRGGRFRFAAPAWATAISWPASAGAGPVVLGWGGGLDFSFDPRGEAAGVCHATVAAAAEGGTGAVRCTADGRSRIELRYDAGEATPGAILRGTLTARDLPCTDGDVADVSGRFNLPILDTRRSE